MSDNKPQDSSGGCCGCMLLLGVILFFAMLFNSDSSSRSSYTPSSAGADEVLRQERDASADTYERAGGIGDTGNTDEAMDVLRERESHLSERIDEVQSSDAYSSEDKERLLRPMEAEHQMLQEGTKAYDSVGD